MRQKYMAPKTGLKPELISKTRLNSWNSFVEPSYSQQKLNKQDIMAMENLRQENVLRKLENIREELREIPGWQQFAKNVLFGENSYHRPYMQVQKEAEMMMLNNSTISFKTNEGVSIEKESFDEERNKIVYDIKVKEFSIDKVKHSKRLSEYIDNGKNNVDIKISEIDRKIKESEIKKEKLGVHFIPFQRKNSANKNLGFDINSKKSHVYEKVLGEKSFHVPSRGLNSASKISYKHVSMITENSLTEISPRFALFPENKGIENKNESKNKQIFENGYRFENGKSLWKKNLNKDEFENSLGECSKSMSLSTENNSRMNWSKTEEAMKERKRRLEDCSEKQKKKEETKKLVKVFCEQVKLDEKFRNSKLWFKSCKNTDKLEKLIKILSLEGLYISLEKVEKDLEVQETEDNPFFSVTSQHCCLEEVAKSYADSEKYWKNEIRQSFKRQKLEEEDFTSSTIDLEKKGCIGLEDLVRFLNMETGTFFRNRDLFGIYKRFCGNNKTIKFEQILSVLCV